MKRHVLWLVTAHLTLIATSGGGCKKGDQAPPTLPAAPAEMVGFLEAAHDTAIVGWAWNQADPAISVSVDIYDGQRLLTTVVANQPRKDLLEGKIGTGKYAFTTPMPQVLKDGQPHQVRALFAGTSTELKNCPKTYQLRPVAK